MFQPNIGLLQTCHQVHEEALDAIYSNRRLCLPPRRPYNIRFFARERCFTGIWLDLNGSCELYFSTCDDAAKWLECQSSLMLARIQGVRIVVRHQVCDLEDAVWLYDVHELHRLISINSRRSVLTSILNPLTTASNLRLMTLTLARDTRDLRGGPWGSSHHLFYRQLIILGMFLPHSEIRRALGRLNGLKQLKIQLVENSKTVPKDLPDHLWVADGVPNVISLIPGTPYDIERSIMQDGLDLTRKELEELTLTITKGKQHVISR